MKNIEKQLDQLKAWDSVPKGLSTRIQEAVHTQAERVDRRYVFWSSVRLALGLCITILGFTALVIQWSYAEPLTYLSSVMSEPTLLLSWSGLRALMEQWMLIPLFLFLGGLIYTVRHIMIRGLKSGRALSHMMAGLFVVVAIGSFVGGIAVGASGSESITAFADDTVFQSFMKPSSGFSYTAKGTIQSVEGESDPLLLLVELELENGETKTLEIPKGIWHKHANGSGFVGRSIFVVGDKGSDENHMRVNFFKLITN